MIANIVPEIKTRDDFATFSYLVPEQLKEDLKIGSVVNIPLGKRVIRGVIADFEDMNIDKAKLKTINSLENLVIARAFLEISRWVAEYYLCSLGEAISLFLPPRMKKPKVTESGIRNQESGKKIELTEEQEQIVRNLEAKLTDPQKPALIHGVTSSGKTEIYIQLAKKALELKKQVVVLVPEIMLTPQTVERFSEALGDKITLMHSNLSKSERYQCFFDYMSGNKPIIIGPRSALLVPNEKTGLIIIDEEQEDSFKQEQNPRYHAVKLAEQISKKLGALLVLGSATPRIETYYKAKNSQYELFTLEERFGSVKMPDAAILDLKQEIKSGNYSPISVNLQDKIKAVLANKRQAILFLNRRGTATFVSCRDCGHVILCKSCSIPMVLYVNDANGFLHCHHCGRRDNAVAICPECKSLRIKYFGAGVDRIHNELAILFPEAKIARIDSNAIKSKKDYDNFYRRFKKHEIDIVIGTQMIAKGLDFPGVDLVGVISADTGLHLPHYRASERTFQILTQVSGRSGRRESRGHTIIQSYWPDSPSILAAAKHDYLQFYNKEIADREKFNYPPFTNLVRILSEDKDEQKARNAAKKAAEELKAEEIEFIGPGACFYKKLHNKYRFHLIVKSSKNTRNVLRKIKSKIPDLIVDVDPADLL